MNPADVIHESHIDLLTRPLFGHFATIRPDGAAQVNPMWFLWDGENLKLTNTTTRRKYRNVNQNPRVALSVIDPSRPYRYLEVRGSVVRIDPDPEGAFFQVLADRYGMAMDGPVGDAADRIVLVIRPDRVSAQ
jgi:PPOX class probable F420-dependent enzyme